MGSIPVASPVPSGGAPRSVRLWLALVSIALVTALAVKFAWPDSGTGSTVVGAVDDFAPGVLVHLEQRSIWLVRGYEDSLFAFSDDDPGTPGEHDCRVEWNGPRMVDGVRGVFETCSGYLFQPGGSTFPGSRTDVSWYPAEVQDDQVRVNLDQPYCNGPIVFFGPCVPSDGSAEPVDPPLAGE